MEDENKKHITTFKLAKTLSSVCLLKFTEEVEAELLKLNVARSSKKERVKTLKIKV